ncbi:MAG: hypothetical protein MUC86_03070 [Burkholderiaceae bacterium]|jgi:hypothetical protein|nr:hypothetical protein [Burkholderiaceae bacterium]
MNTGRAPAAPAANHAWPNLFVSLGPDVAEAGDTGPALTEAQFAALVRVLADTRRTSVASAISPCADR